MIIHTQALVTDYSQVPSSRLITSYPIPPQESFTCAPYSIRVRRAGSEDVLRYTFIATKDAVSQKITLFKDVSQPDGRTTSTTETQTLKTPPIQYLTLAISSTQTSAIGDLIGVCQDGQVVSLTGEKLDVQWTASSKPMVQDVSTTTISDFAVDFVSSGTRSELSESIFKSRPEAFAALPKAADTDSTLLVLISRSSIEGQLKRQLVVLAVASGSASDAQKLSPLDISPIPTAAQVDNTPLYEIDLAAGVLQQLQKGSLDVYDITSAVPKLKSTVRMDGASSFTNLSKPFVLSSSSENLGLYNYQYRSIHAYNTLDLSDLPTENQKISSCQLITYLRRSELAVALMDNVLVAMQIEAPKTQGKKRKGGLLIDSIGRGTAVEVAPKKVKIQNNATEFSHQVAGTMTESYLAQFNTDVEAADELLSNNQISKWEELLRQKFGMQIYKTESAAEEVEHDNSEAVQWHWPETPHEYPSVDRRWILYAISQIFSVGTGEGDDARPKLRLLLPDINVTSFLICAGHLTLSNIKSAFREDLEGNGPVDKDLAGDLIAGLTEADPAMTLLLSYLQATKLGEVEVLLAIRALMLSMDLIPRTGKDKTKLLKNEAHQEGEDYEMDLDDLEREIAVTELYLGDESSNRSRGLTLAFFKLWRLPARNTIKALRTALQTEEILSLVHLLRVELVQGAWTSLYIDPTSFDLEGSEAPPDSVIALVSDLLGRCIDAVGAGGWLLNDAMYGLDSPDNGDFVTALKLEVAAALEGIEEAVYLQGVVGESVRYGTMLQKSGRLQSANTTVMEGRESRILPLGLRTKQLPTKDKVISGGEVVQRTGRELGHLVSQKVAEYSIEKLTI